MKKLIFLTLLSLFTILTWAQKLEPEHKIINFGTIPMKPQSEKVVKLYNRTDKPVVIKTIKLDCNCTKLYWDKRPIKAGDSTVIRVTYIPSETGVFYKKATVISTVGNVELIIRGTVK